ncbi:unnamed protein product [Closterium sp. NIES-65]|nr:unnamed protein product [Closterium sp. NIES-65]
MKINATEAETSDNDVILGGAHKANVARASGACLLAKGLKGKEWYMDSGCTQHMTNRKEWLQNFRASPIPYVLLGDEGKLPVKGEGDLVLQSAYGEVKLDNVLLVDKLTRNLISQSQLDSGGCKTFSDKGSIWVFGSDWKVIAEGSCKQGLYEMKLHKKQSGEKPTYMAEPEAGKVARDELRTKLKKVPIKELQQQALPMAAAVSTVDVNLLHRRMGHAGHTRIKQLVKKNMAAGVKTGKVTATRDVTFYEQDTYLEWKGRKQGAVAKELAAAPTPVEDMIDGSEKEGIGAANGSGNNDDYEDHTTPGFDWVWEVQELSSPSTAVEEGEEENDKGEEAGDSATNEAGEEEAEISDVEESVAESASTGYSDPWRIIDTGDNEKAAAEIEDLLVDGAIIIGREIEGYSVQQGTDDNAAAEKCGAENENEEMGKGKRVKKHNPNSLADKEVDVGAEIEAWGNRERALKAYQSMVGSVMYTVSCTRVDVAYAASFLGQRVLHPEGRKWKEIERTITYLLQGDDEGLLFEGGEESLELVGYADASHGSDKKDGRGAYGYVYLLGGTAIMWQAKKLTNVALSTEKAMIMRLLLPAVGTSGLAAEEVHPFPNLKVQVMNTCEDVPGPVRDDERVSVPGTKAVFHPCGAARKALSVSMSLIATVPSP